MSGMSRVKVYVRTRPTANFAQERIELLSDGKTINIRSQKDQYYSIANNQLFDSSFKLDGVLHNASQEQVYEEVASELVLKVAKGFNGTLLAYGQTGAGKTFTMSEAAENFKLRGIIPRAIAQIFRNIDEQGEKTFNVLISYLEIYNETLVDLLATLPAPSRSENTINNLSIVEGDDGSVRIHGLSLHPANNAADALNLFFEGETNRVVAAHSLNNNSSRSHCIFTVYLESGSRAQSHSKCTTSKLNFVDLAGSERIGKSRRDDRFQQEAKHINKSLTFLEQTVMALADKSRDHIPFRQSKLTHALKGSIGGKCYTSMIVNIYGEESHLEETISSLRFAMRMKRVAVEPATSFRFDPWVLIHELRAEIAHLKQELNMHCILANQTPVDYEPLTQGQQNAIQKQVRIFLECKSNEIDVDSLRQIKAVFSQFRSVVASMEGTVLRKLRQKYILLNKNDASLMATLQRSGLPFDEDGNFISMPDSGLAAGVPGIASSVGVATSSSKVRVSSMTTGQQAASAIKRKLAKKSKGSTASPRRESNGAPQVEVRTGKARPSATTDSAESVKKEESATSADAPSQEEKQASRPSTPPSRAHAFEEFKSEQGREINRILSENKMVLQSKKRLIRDIGRAVNATKHMIDGIRKSLEEKRKRRIKQGEFVNDKGETVIDEEEFSLMARLKKLKHQYRIDHNELCNVKLEIEYCQKLVDRCRLKLVQEFDAWYWDSFMGGPMTTSASAGYGTRPGLRPPTKLRLTANQANMDDEQEKFDQIEQQLLMEHPESAAFYYAKLKTHRRHENERAMSRGPPRRNAPTTGISKGAKRNRPSSQPCTFGVY